MRRRLAIASMFVFFAIGYATLERLPRSAVMVLRGGAEFVLRTGDADVISGTDA